MYKSITVFFLLMSLTGFSQNRFAVIGGVSNSTFSEGFLEHVYFNDAFGFHIGGLYEHQLNDKIAFRPKLVFSLQGDRDESSPDHFFNIQIIDYKLSYLNVPLNFKFFSKPYIIVGPQVGFLLSTEKGDRDFGEIESKFDYGLNAGFGYDFKHVFIEFNMYQGLATLMELNNGTINPTNTVFQFSLGYYFN